jgi:hypothetical protein
MTWQHRSDSRYVAFTLPTAPMTRFPIQPYTTVRCGKGCCSCIRLSRGYCHVIQTGAPDLQVEVPKNTSVLHGTQSWAGAGYAHQVSRPLPMLGSNTNAGFGSNTHAVFGSNTRACVWFQHTRLCLVPTHACVWFQHAPVFGSNTRACVWFF